MPDAHDDALRVIVSCPVPVYTVEFWTAVASPRADVAVISTRSLPDPVDIVLPDTAVTLLSSQTSMNTSLGISAPLGLKLKVESYCTIMQ